MTQKNQIVTFGCRLNIYESEVMREVSSQAGLENAIIFNTCAVTAEAERQARQAIRKARRENLDKKIIVTGCAAQINPDLYGKMDEVDQVLGNHEKMKADSFMSTNTKKILVNDIMSVKETATHMVTSFDGKTRAFVEVQNGCDHRCTFCTIPYGRGNSRSVPIGLITDQVQKLVKEGFTEVILTGVDVTSYGGDLPGNPTLGQMMKRLLARIPDLKRLRLSSLDPVEVDKDLFQLIETEPRLMPHLHISLQAGDDMILKRMKRRHLRQDVIDFCQKVKMMRPEAAFGADVIAGFPTEDDTMFEKTRQLIEECEIAYMHVFPYSPRPETPAAKMPQVGKTIAKQRAGVLRDVGQKNLDKLLRSMIGSSQNILVEKDNLGRCENFAQAILPFSGKPNQIIKAKVVGVENDKLITEV